MRLAVVLGAICALTQTASAEIGDCSTIPDAAAKLACYNNEAPPKAVRSSTARRPAAARAPATAADSPKGIDRPSNEDAAVDAKMRSLCRGC
jgi:hypothetical protein